MSTGHQSSSLPNRSLIKLLNYCIKSSTELSSRHYIDSKFIWLKGVGVRWHERACCTGAEKMEPSEYYPELLVLTDHFSHHTIRRNFTLVTSFMHNIGDVVVNIRRRCQIIVPLRISRQCRGQADAPPLTSLEVVTAAIGTENPHSRGARVQHQILPTSFKEPYLDLGWVECTAPSADGVQQFVGVTRRINHAANAAASGASPLIVQPWRHLLMFASRQTPARYLAPVTLALP
ncbi:unnamed protein product [Spodoptera exigua]|nr:unnamed protein product [Spodoptera exigua]